MNIKKIGENIRQYRKIKGFTQESLAQRANLSVMSIRRYESGKRIAPISTIHQIADALSINTEDLMTGSMWEEYDKTINTRELAVDVKKLEIITNYLEELGFAVEYLEYDENDFEVTLAKEGHKATFTATEFEELKDAAKEAINGKFYKKALEQQNKK